MRRHSQTAWSSLARKLKATSTDPTPFPWGVFVCALGLFLVAALIFAAIAGGN